MKCKTCCFYTILEPNLNSVYNCVRHPPVLWKSQYLDCGPETKYPAPNSDHWCGDWKPQDFIKSWPTNLIKDYD